MEQLIVITLALIGLGLTLAAPPDGWIFAVFRAAICTTHVLLVVAWLTWAPRLLTP